MGLLCRAWGQRVVQVVALNEQVAGTDVRPGRNLDGVTDSGEEYCAADFLNSCAVL